TGRKRKKFKLNKYVFPLIIGFLLIKSVILPLALKALAILSGKAVVLSLMSLILAAIVGLRTVASGGGTTAQNKIDLASNYKRKDMQDYIDPIDDNPYRYYADHTRRKK
ncbi:PREDICTED: uncharacterized protein LOC105368405, partial [Ceratosolen solmsi marchali]|uniref:Uncharacterized protein LOC105368405 n=1 Tax=Ceratosolen solmsi marchali TaxID=326594 RepID=A0AAJ6YWL5_9HYME